MKFLFFIFALSLTVPSAQAEQRAYGKVWLNGLARNSWSVNYPRIQNAMVCNVNGPDKFLSVRACPSTNCPVLRSLKRLAILRVDTGTMRGDWIRVLTAHRDFDEHGWPQRTKDLHVDGWAHMGYMCDYMDF